MKPTFPNENGYQSGYCWVQWTHSLSNKLSQLRFIFLHGYTYTLMEPTFPNEGINGYQSGYIWAQWLGFAFSHCQTNYPNSVYLYPWWKTFHSMGVLMVSNWETLGHLTDPITYLFFTYLIGSCICTLGLQTKNVGIQTWLSENKKDIYFIYKITKLLKHTNKGNATVITT